MWRAAAPTAASVPASARSTFPLHLLNRKFIKDINELYGEYQAGADVGSRARRWSTTPQDDCRALASSIREGVQQMHENPCT